MVALPLALGCSAGVDREAGPTTLGGDDGGGLNLGDGAIPADVGIFSAVQITPSNAVLTIDLTTAPASPATQAYTVKVRRDDGTDDDVSASAVFKIDPKFGSFAGNAYTSGPSLPDGKPQATIFSAEVTDAEGKVKVGEAQLTLIALRKTGDKRDFFFLEPYRGSPSPSRDVLKFNTNIKQVDVAFCVDTTGSMGGVISAIKTELSTKIIPKLKLAIPNVGIAVSGHDDFPVSPFGSTPDMPFYLLQTVTASVTAAQAGVNALAIHNGNDGPESQYEGIYQILTGEGVAWKGGSIKKKTNAPGTFGYVDFRPGSLPVAVLVTDIDFHPKDDYAPIVEGTPAPHGREEVVAAYKKTFARHVGISTSGGWGGSSDPNPQQKDLAKESGSYVSPKAFKGACGAGKCCTEQSGAARDPDGPGGTCLMSFRASSTGSGVSDGIVGAIAALSAGSNFDVTASVSNDATNPDGVDATKFVKALRAMKEGDSKQGCDPATTKDTNADGIDDTFVGVVVGAPVCFEVIPADNDFVPAGKQPQFFNAFIDILGMPGSVKLDQRKVLFLVPPADIIAK
ncbi:MAG: hypothetical protein HYV09_28195 [Deltaproteobacteria bacterium]|nr:hypothetical protein [Deltaproteobacteria bacterium]